MKTRIPYRLLYCAALLIAGTQFGSAIPINTQCTIALLGSPGSSGGGDNCIALFSQPSLSQSFSTVPGEQYTLSFYLAASQQGTGSKNPFQLSSSFGSESLGSITLSGAGGNHMVWQQFVYTVSALSDLTALTLLNSGSNPAERWAVEDVTLTPVTLSKPVTSAAPEEELTPTVPETADSSVLALTALSLVACGFLQKRLGQRG